MSNEIKICYVTRKNMQISLIWPTNNEELHPGIWYYVKISVFLLCYGMFPFGTFLHLIVVLKSKLSLLCKILIFYTFSKF